MKVLVVLLSVVALAGWGLILVSALENPRSTFATLADAEQAGMIGRGWLPPFLPQSAVRITEGHNLDTNAVWACFWFTPGDTSAVEASCRKVAASSSGTKFLCPPYDDRTSTIVLRNSGEGYYLSHSNPI